MLFTDMDADQTNNWAAAAQDELIEFQQMETGPVGNTAFDSGSSHSGGHFSGLQNIFIAIQSQPAQMDDGFTPLTTNGAAFQSLYVPTAGDGIASDTGYVTVSMAGNDASPVNQRQQFIQV